MGARREVGGSRGLSLGSRWRSLGPEQVGPRAGPAGMSNGIGQGGREGPAYESQVSGGAVQAISRRTPTRRKLVSNFPPRPAWTYVSRVGLWPTGP